MVNSNLMKLLISIQIAYSAVERSAAIVNEHQPVKESLMQMAYNWE